MQSLSKQSPNAMPTKEFGKEGAMPKQMKPGKSTTANPMHADKEPACRGNASMFSTRGQKTAK